MIALHNALVELGHDVWTIDGFNPEINTYEFIDWPRKPQEGKIDEPDLFIYNCYWELVEPWGKHNWLYCLYPRQLWNTERYDRILTLSRYSQQAIQTRWAREAKILIGGVFSDDWKPSREKKNAILSCSRFFIEGDVNTLQGHSKNQHVLIEAFKHLNLEGWELWLAGSTLLESDWDYLGKCRELARGHSIRFFPMVGKEELRALYRSAKIFWHGMGYGRADPAEVEHFGFVTLKARLSGNWCLTHTSGNLDLSHYTWREPEELVSLTKELIELDGEPPPLLEGDRHIWSRDFFREQVEWLIRTIE